MKILFLCSGLHGLGGTAKHLTTLVVELRKRGHDARILAASRDIATVRPYLEEKLEHEPTEVFELIDIAKQPIRGALKLLWKIRTSNASTLVSVFVMSEILAGAALRIPRIFRRKPKLVSLIEVEHFSRSYSPRKDRLMKALHRFFCQGKFEVVAISPHLSEGAKVIPLGASQEEFSALAEAARSRRPKDEIRVLFVGRFVEDKGIQTLLGAIEMLSKAGKARIFRFEFVGAGPLGPEMQRRLAHAPGVQFRVSPWTLKIAEKYRNNDVLVLPSHHEGLSWVVVEAMITGCIVVGSAIPSIKALLGEGRGILLNENNAQNVMGALMAIADNGLDAYRTRLAKNQKWAMQKFNLENEIEAWLPVLGAGAVPRFLIQELWNLGDLIHAIPLALGLREKFPGCEIFWVCQSKVASTLKELVPAPLRTDVLECDVPWVAPTGKYNPFKYLPWKFSGLRKKMRQMKISTAFDLRGDLRSNLLLRLAPCDTRFVFSDSRVPGFLEKFLYGRSTKTVSLPKSADRRFTRAHVLGKAFKKDFPTRKPSIDIGAFASRPNTVLWHPGARFLNRAVPAQTVLETLKLAKKRLPYLEWTLALGPDDFKEAEPEKISEIARFARILRPSVKELARAMGSHEVVIACDSGPLHIASALNKKTVGVFFYDTIAEWGPFSERFQVVSPSLGANTAESRYGSSQNKQDKNLNPESLIDAVSKLLGAQN